MSPPPKRYRTLLRAACLALPLVMGCQMVSGDEVPRTPPLLRGTGGSAGRDVAVPDEPLADRPAAPGAYDASPPAEVSPSYDGGIDAATEGEACARDASCDWPQ